MTDVFDVLRPHVLTLGARDLRILPNMSTALISWTLPLRFASLLLSKIQTSVLTPVSLAAGPLSERHLGELDH